MDKNKTIDTSVLTKEFFIYFIAVDYVRGSYRLNLTTLEEFIERISNNDKEALKALSDAVKELSKLRIVKKYNNMCDFVEVINGKKMLGFLDANRNDFDKVSSFRDEYLVHEKTVPNKIARAYDMMIDPEAVDMRRERERKQMEKEALAHAYSSVSIRRY